MLFRKDEPADLSVDLCDQKVEHNVMVFLEQMNTILGDFLRSDSIW